MNKHYSNNKIKDLKNKITRLKTEGLRKPSARKDNEIMSVSYGPSTSTDEEIKRRVKTLIIPHISNILYEIEMIYNTYSSSSHETDKEASKQEKELGPLEKIHKLLKKAEEVAISCLSNRTKELTEENPAGAGMSQFGDTPVGDSVDLDYKGGEDEGVFFDNDFEIIDIINDVASMDKEELKQKLRGIGSDEIEKALEVLKKIKTEHGEESF